MKLFIIFLLTVHGAVHLLGLKPDAIISSGESGASWMGSGISWLIPFFLLLSAAVFSLLGKWWWWGPALVGVLVSQLLIIFFWKEAKWGTVPNTVLFISVLLSFSAWNFDRITKDQAATLLVAQPPSGRVITPDMILHLPSPVKKWLLHSGMVGKKEITSVQLKQKGSMRINPASKKWMSSNATQYTTISKPGFVWSVRMKMNLFLRIYGRDVWSNGTGRMKMTAWSLIPVMNAGGKKIDEGALQRWLAEMAWYPSAALHPGIKWEHINDISAKATLFYEGIQGSVIYYFNADGDMAGCSAGRFRGANSTSRELWEVRSLSFANMNGIRIPVRSEATWKLKEGDFTWYRLEITSIEYNRGMSE